MSARPGESLFVSVFKYSLAAFVVMFLIMVGLTALAAL